MRALARFLFAAATLAAIGIGVYAGTVARASADDDTAGSGAIDPRVAVTDLLALARA